MSTTTQIQRVFEALADPTRRAILRLLRERAMVPTEIAERFAITKQSLSYHLKALRAANLVVTERRGQHVVYALNVTVFDEVAALLFDLFAVDATAPPRRNHDEPQPALASPAPVDRGGAGKRRRVGRSS